MTIGHLYKSIPRVSPDVIASLKGIGVADLHDALNVDWRSLTLMHGAMRPIISDVTIVGQAVTAFCPAGDNLMMHCALFVAQAGDVLVVSNGGSENGALWGENATIQAQKKGLAAVVVDGPARDTDAVRRRGFPAWSTSISVSTPTKAKIGSLNMPVSCAGVIVNPGDIVVADGDGVLVLPPDVVAATLERVRARLERDKVTHAKIEAGGTLFQSAQMDVALQKLGVEIQDRTWNGK